MILIQIDSSTKPVNEGLKVAVQKYYPEANIRLDKGLIVEAIERVERIIGKNRRLRDYGRDVIMYLRSLMKYTDDDCIVKWVAKEGRLYSKPINLLEHSLFKIKASDFIIPTLGKMITLDFKELMNLLAFECSYRDLWEESDISPLERANNWLDSHGILPARVNKIKELDGFIEPDAYKSVMDYGLIVGNSKYFSGGDKIGKGVWRNRDRGIGYQDIKVEFLDYFRNKIDIDGLDIMKIPYSIWMESTRVKVMEILVQRILTGMMQERIKGISLYGVYKDTICFGADTDFDIKKLGVEVLITVFGRGIQVKPKVITYKRVQVGGRDNG